MKIAWLFPILLASAGSSQAAGPRDNSEIEALQESQADAWNRHDIRAYAALFSADADVVNVLGWHWRSRAELEEKLGRAFASVFADSQLTIQDVTIEYVKRDIAVAYVSWTMTGARSPTATGSNAPEKGIQMQVLRKQDGEWRITHFQNTNSIPEAQFPSPS